jgi:bacillithiol biosynthesis cysteine-adding enzyme BshC
LVSSARSGLETPVGTVEFGPGIEPVVEAAAAILGTSDVTELLRASYRPADNYGSAFARLFTKLFSDWGVILLDSLDPDLHAIAAPIYRGAIERAAEIDDHLLQRGRELEGAGYHQQVRVTPSSTLLFTLRDGARTVIHRRVNGSDTAFVAGEEQIPKAQMLERISSAPDQFSPNVLLRPVVQDYLLPTLTYAGGAAEVAYFAQAAVVYECLLGHVTPIVPRFSATLIDAKAQRLLSKYELNLVDMLQAPETVRQTLAARALPADLQSAFESAGAAVESSFAAIRSALAKLDPTLVDAADRAGSKIQHQIEHLRASAARAELRQSELLDRHAAFLNIALFPNRTLQEREIAGISFLARHGLNLLTDLYASIHTDCLKHQVISLSL